MLEKKPHIVFLTTYMSEYWATFIAILGHMQASS